jgi:hypothetical protein
MKKLVAMVVIEIVAMTCLGVWMASGTQNGSRPNAFTALSYVVFSAAG